MICLSHIRLLLISDKSDLFVCLEVSDIELLISGSAGTLEIIEFFYCEKGIYGCPFLFYISLFISAITLKMKSQFLYMGVFRSLF